MASPTAWDPEGLRTKARLYFERAFDVDDQRDPLFAFWCHLAVELLARAAIAEVHPALLSGPKRDSLMYGLGLGHDEDGLGPESAPSVAVYELCGRFVNGFGGSEKAACEEARRRRNAELHGAVAAFEDLPRGWLGRFFAACRVLAAHMGLALSDLLGDDNAALAERLILDDAEQVQTVVRDLVEAARLRFAAYDAETRARREEAAANALEPRSDPFGSVSPFARTTAPRIGVRQCPACENKAVLRGERLTRGRPRVSVDGELIEPTVAVPIDFECPTCDLHLEGVAQLTVAGLGDPVTLLDYPDPLDTFNIDISDYRDEFLQSLADDYAYQDE